MASGFSPVVDGPDGFEGLQIEDSGGASAPVAGESAAELRGDGNSVNALSVGDLPNHRKGIGIEDKDFCRVRNVDPPSVAVDTDVIPKSVSR